MPSLLFRNCQCFVPIAPHPLEVDLHPSVDTISLRKYATSTPDNEEWCPVNAKPEDLTSADALFREFLKQMKQLVKSERPRVETFTQGKSAQADDDVAVFAKKGKVDPKKYVVDLSLQQYAAAQAFAILLAENNRRLLELMYQGPKK